MKTPTANEELMRFALMGIEAQIQELQNLRATYVSWLNGDDGYGHLPPHEDGPRPGRPKKARELSAEGRKAISEAQKRRWAKKPIARPGKKGRKPMSAAARAKLSKLMKDRWIAKKRAAAKVA